MNETDRWSRVLFVARLLSDDVDTSDMAAVARELLAARLCSADFADILPSVIAYVRAKRRGERMLAGARA